MRAGHAKREDEVLLIEWIEVEAAEGGGGEGRPGRQVERRAIEAARSLVVGAAGRAPRGGPGRDAEARCRDC